MDLTGHDQLLLVAAGEQTHRRGLSGGAGGAHLVALDLFLGCLEHGLAVQQPLVGEGSAAVVPKHQVFRHIHVCDQTVVEAVVGDVDHTPLIPLPDIFPLDLLSVQDHSTLGGMLDAGDDLGQLLLAVALNAGHTKDLSPAQLQGDIVEGMALLFPGQRDGLQRQ